MPCRPCFARAPRSTRRPLLLAAVLLSLLGHAAPALARDRILIVGNSFTAGIKARLQAIVRSSGRDAVVAVLASDGWTLADHAASRRTVGKIRSSAWTHVVLQEQSLGTFASRYPAARALDAEITAIGGRTVFLMTWRDRDADLASYDALRGEPGGDVGYVPIAFELGAPVAPVGWAFREMLLENPSASLWGPDGHHSSERGRYLAALVLFTTIYGESPVGLWPTPFLTGQEVLHDQRMVERVVLGDPGAWDIEAPVAAPVP